MRRVPVSSSGGRVAATNPTSNRGTPKVLEKEVGPKVNVIWRSPTST